MNISPEKRGKNWGRGYNKPSIRYPKLRRQKKWAKRFASFCGIKVLDVKGRVIIIESTQNIKCMRWYQFMLVPRDHPHLQEFLKKPHFRSITPPPIPEFILIEPSQGIAGIAPGCKFNLKVLK